MIHVIYVIHVIHVYSEPRASGGAAGLGLQRSMDRRYVAAAAEPQHARHAVPNLRAALPVVPGACLGGSWWILVEVW